MSHLINLVLSLAFTATSIAFAQEMPRITAEQAFNQFGGVSPLLQLQKSEQRAASVQQSQRWPLFFVRTNGQYFSNKDRLNLVLLPSDLLEGTYHISARVMLPSANRYPDGSRIEYFDAEGAMFGYFYRGFGRNDKLNVFSREFSNADPDGVYFVEVIVWSVTPSGIHNIIQQNFISLKLNSDGSEDRWDGSIREVRLVGDTLEIRGMFPSGTALVRQEVVNGGTVAQISPMELTPTGNVVRVPSNFHERRARAYITLTVLGDPYTSTVMFEQPALPRNSNAVAVPIISPPR